MSSTGKNNPEGVNFENGRLIPALAIDARIAIRSGNSDPAGMREI